MGSSASMKLSYAILIAMLMAAPHAEAAISCGVVSSKLIGCIGYLMGGRGPSRGCCGGIRSLQRLARTPGARRLACRCLTTASRGIRGLNFRKAATLPRRCGVRIPYAISPHTNCNAYVPL